MTRISKNEIVAYATVYSEPSYDESWHGVTLRHDHAAALGIDREVSYRVENGAACVEWDLDRRRLECEMWDNPPDAPAQESLRDRVNTSDGARRAAVDLLLLGLERYRSESNEGKLRAALRRVIDTYNNTSGDLCQIQEMYCACREAEKLLDATELTVIS